MTQENWPMPISAVEFFADAQPIEWHNPQPAQQPIEQIKQTQEIVEQPQIDENRKREIQANIDADLEKELELVSKIDELLREVEEWKSNDVVVEITPSTDNIVPEPAKPASEDVGDDALTYEEQQELLDLVESLDKEVKMSTLDYESKLEELKYQNELLRNRSSEYMDKVRSLEEDHKTIQWRVVPTDLEELAFLYAQTKKDPSDRISRDRFKKELITLTEKEFGRPLDNYIEHSYTYWNMDMSWSESFWQYNLDWVLKWGGQKRQWPKTAAEAVEQLMDRF